MSVDVSDLSLELCEAVGATFLVCDWNVRAWTMLEAMKGSHNLQFLCSGEKVLSLRACFDRLHREGRIDLAVLLLACQHLMPASTDAFRRPSSRKTLEMAGSILSHRHASRPRDDIVIWSLISGTEVYYNAETMWRALMGRRITTAFLMSNTSRLTHIPGLSWAPETPYIRRAPAGHGSALDHFLTYEGTGSEEALVTPQGLRGDWMVYRANPADHERFKDRSVVMIEVGDRGHRTEKTLDGHRILNRCWKTVMELLNKHADVILLQPKLLTSQTSYDLARDRGESHGEVFAICVSEDGERWRWHSVASWPNMELPEMEVDDILIC